MKKHISFPSIEQFRNIIGTINRQYNFVGLDSDGNAIYDLSKPKPKVIFKGTVKLHGTNAGISFSKSDGIWAQSRENIITPLQDNAGFACFVEKNKDSILELINSVYVDNNLNDNLTVTIFGEWCGKGIQKGVAISNIDKSFFIFGIKVSKPDDENFKAYWIDSSKYSNPNQNIFNVEDYSTWNLEIDFNYPQLVQNELIRITEEVERECPIGKAFGHLGIGEGVVWLCNIDNNVHRFKVKGEKHSVSKVKTLASVDVEKVNSVKEFVDMVVTEQRFNQSIEKVFGSVENIDITKMGDLMRWFIGDVMKEELDTLLKNNLTPKDVNSSISAKVREMFFKLQTTT